MIQVHGTDADDPEFLALVRDVLGGLADKYSPLELHLIHIDNWFDHKWLGFAGKALGAVGVWKEGERLTVPAFKPSRVLSHQFACRTDADGPFRELPPPTELHLEVWSADNLQRRIAAVTGNALVVWYTGNTKSNGRGAMMSYSVAESADDTWYASFRAGPEWRVEKTKNIAASELDRLAGRRLDGVQQADAADGPSGRS